MAKNKMKISPSLVERVLEKLNFNHKPDVSESGLTDIYQSWCRTVPFDNIRKRILPHDEISRPMPGYIPSDFFSHWLRYGTGGTCWAGHGALYALLSQLGFPVQFGISTMLSHRLGNGESPGHGTLIVNFFDNPLIVDATMLHGQPLPIREWGSFHPVWGTHVHHSEGFWCVNWKPLGRARVDCRLLDTKVSDDEFPRRHELSRNNSRFDGAVLIRLAGNESITGIVKGEKVTRDATGTELFSPLSHEEQKRLLVEHFHIAEEVVAMLPEDDVELPL